MAKIGTTPVASRYDGIPVGPRVAYLFETQEGVPVDGTNSMLRELSPFTFRLVPPEALLETAASSEDNAVDLIQAASLGASTGGVAAEVSRALSTVTITNTSVSAQVTLEQFVALGQFYTGSSNTFISTLADAFQAADVALQLQRILAAEPLTLLVNPTEMSIQFTKIQNYQSRTRYGYEFESWGEDQPTISISGTTAGFVAGAVNITSPFGAQVSSSNSSVSGYQEAARRDSAAWQNFVSLYHFYRNNGYIYDTINRSEAHLFVGSVAIDYDQWTYVGSIESFSYRVEAESPHKVTFDLEFRVSRRYDRSASASTVMPQRSPTSPRTPLFGSSGTSLNNQLTTSGSNHSELSQTPLDILGGG